jgi:transcriptional regulator with XRE-family HTH domain
MRTNLGFSQVKLAHESKVSLPTIQNIEARKGNPTIDVLEKLLKALGMELILRPVSFELNMAIILGVPLSSTLKINKSIPPTAALLKSEAVKWNYGFHNHSLLEREEDALIGFLMAVKDHYPTFYKNEICFPIFEKKIKKNKLSARIIKLRRIALEKMSKYL